MQFKAIIALLLIVNITAFAATDSKPFASGIYDLLPAPNGDPGDISQKPFLTNPNVDGARLRTWIDNCEPIKSTFDWSIIDRAKQSCSQHGKKLSVSVGFGLMTPQWFYDEGCIKFAPSVGGEGGEFMPLPWDTTFQGFAHEFILAFGARYNNDPTISEVIITGFMQGNEMRMVATSGDEARLDVIARRAGFDNAREAWLDAAKQFVNWFAEAFPNTSIVLTTARPFPDDTEDQRAIEDYGKTAFPGHFGIMTAYLKAHEAPYDPPREFTYPRGDQAIFSSVDLERFYGGNVPVPRPTPPKPVDDLLESGVEKGDQKVELYEADIENPANQSALANGKAKLKANLP